MSLLDLPDEAVEAVAQRIPDKPARNAFRAVSRHTRAAANTQTRKVREALRAHERASERQQQDKMCYSGMLSAHAWGCAHL